MINQAIHFIDTPLISNSVIVEPGTYNIAPCPKSQTYMFAIKTSIDGGYNYSDILFYGNKYLEAGAEYATMSINDFAHYLTYIPSFDDLKSMTANKVYFNYIVKTIDYKLYSEYYIAPEYEMARNTYTVADIYRYPNYHTDLDVMIGDPVIPQTHQNVIHPLVQGIIRDNERGQVCLPASGDYFGDNFILTPKFPTLKDENDNIICELYVGFQSNVAAGPVYAIYSQNYLDIDFDLLDYNGISRGIPHTGYVHLKHTFNGANIVDSVYFHTDDAGYSKIADIDWEPCTRYYLMWQDRYSGYQSQPFEKGSTFKETFNVSEVQDYSNKRIISQVDSQPQWEINTGWIDNKVYPIYESIFTSKVLVLTDTVENIQYEVVLKDKTYTEKTFTNQNRKMFNLKLNLELARKQYIRY